MISTLADLGGHVVVVLTGDDPDRQMPWLDMVDSVVQAWAWRDAHARPLAALLSGQQEFSGHLPVTLTGGFYPPGMVDADYRAFERAHVAPLFPFGYGLSARGHLTLSDLHVVREGTHLNASFSVTNPDGTAVRAIPQLYVSPSSDQAAPRRLAAWSSIMVAPGHTLRLTLPVSLRLLAQWNAPAANWAVAAGIMRSRSGFRRSCWCGMRMCACPPCTCPPRWTWRQTDAPCPGGGYWPGRMTVQGSPCSLSVAQAPVAAACDRPARRAR
ncbi:glycoside hydrolase family 3 C-terminal domain-containing protein [Komagataeibacter rhaeticus]|nr:glycoside hydrolase family 3 C-terminal domain-containing protein [Komagataeibacter rhaeticus]